MTTEVSIRPMEDADWPDVRRIYAQGIATRNATFETRVPSRATLHRKWLAGQRWVAQLDGDVVGWAAVTAVSSRECYAGVVESSIYIGDGMRGRGIGKVLITQQVRATDDAGFWTLQTSIFPENKASIRLHEWAGFRVVGVRERIAQLDGQWRDTVLLERRSPTL
ncbi:MAG TPA: GNAT family N-acetyltransferase [Jiangellaceae bacterium]|nr:GNAT family N-acetyltransferase [Jiangellaceae bacterium]